jgi:hypothetical protein
MKTEFKPCFFLNRKGVSDCKKAVYDFVWISRRSGNSITAGMRE